MVGCLAGGRDDAIYAPLNEGGGCFLPCGKFDFSFVLVDILVGYP